MSVTTISTLLLTFTDKLAHTSAMPLCFIIDNDLMVSGLHDTIKIFPRTQPVTLEGKMKSYSTTVFSLSVINQYSTTWPETNLLRPRYTNHTFNLHLDINSHLSYRAILEKA